MTDPRLAALPDETLLNIANRFETDTLGVFYNMLHGRFFENPTPGWQGLRSLRATSRRFPRIGRDALTEAEAGCHIISLNLFHSHTSCDNLDMNNNLGDFTQPIPSARLSAFDEIQVTIPLHFMSKSNQYNDLLFAFTMDFIRMGNTFWVCSGTNTETLIPAKYYGGHLLTPQYNLWVPKLRSAALRALNLGGVYQLSTNRLGRMQFALEREVWDHWAESRRLASREWVVSDPWTEATRLYAKLVQ